MHCSGNVKCSDDFQNLVLQSIRSLGVKHRFKKINFKSHEDSRGPRGDGQVFKKPLSSLRTEFVTLKSGASVEIPCFVSEACLHIRQCCGVEGIFRKAGSSARAREMKTRVDNGSPLGPQHHVIDVANILKLFLRELPEPLLPFSCHDLLLSCLLLKEKAVEGILLSCLLFPTLHLNTLAYLMEFFKDVSDQEDQNKMSITNLAIIITPTIMPVEEKRSFSSGSRLEHHVKVIECLIQNNSRIGFLPDYLVDKAVSVGCLLNENDMDQTDESKLKKKKKRRSGSLTRMFNGLRKMVGKGSPDVNEDSPSLCDLSSPGTKSAKKRKVQETALSSFSSKKKRDVLGTSTAPTPCTPCTPCTPLPAAISELYHTPKIRAQATQYGKSKTPHCRQMSRKFFTPKPRAESFMSAKLEARSKMHLRQTVSSSPRKDTELDKAAKRQRLMNTGFYADKGHTSLDWKKDSCPKELSDAPNCSEVSSVNCTATKTPDSLFGSESTFTGNYESGIDLSGSGSSPENTEFVKIPKSEFEEIKNRVSAIENRISLEFNCFASDPSNLEDIPLIDESDDETSSARKVQEAYEKALEESEKLTDSNSTDHLAKRLSKELKIRQSLENKVIRSPSARKIGTIRRRSRENARSFLDRSLRSSLRQSAKQSAQGQLCPRSNLRRGRPNTVYTGLPQPCALLVSTGAVDGDLSPLVDSDNTGGGSAASNSHISGSEHVEDDFPREVRKAYSFHCSSATSDLDTTPCIRKSVSQSEFVHSPSCIETPVQVKGNQEKNKEHWESAQHFFKTKEALHLPLSGRESVMKIRSQNAGMVLARTRMFDKDCPSGTPLRAPFAAMGAGETSSEGGNKSRSNSLRIKCIQGNFLSRLNGESTAAAEKDHVFATPSSKQMSHPEIAKKIGSPRKKYTGQKSPAAHRQKAKLSNSPLSVEKVVRFAKENKVPRFCSMRMRSYTSPVGAKVNVSAPGSAYSGKENLGREKNTGVFTETIEKSSENTDVLKEILLPDNLKETIYDICTPKTEKLTKLSISPLKDSNRMDKNWPSMFEARRVNSTATCTTPYIKEPLLVRSPCQFPHTPHLHGGASDSRLVTPMRALHNLGTPRHSPRLAAAKSRNLVLKS